MFVDVDTPAGPTFVWVTEPSHPGNAQPTIAWSADFIPPAPLFQVPGTGWTLATDELADQVMRAGTDEVVFMDVTNDGTRTGIPE